VPGRSTRSLAVIVEARYKCKNCEERFAVPIEPGTSATSSSTCPTCGQLASVAETMDPSGYEPKVWPAILGLEVFWWVLIALTTGAGAVVVCR